MKRKEKTHNCFIQASLAGILCHILSKYAHLNKLRAFDTKTIFKLSLNESF